jgi:hypothetical protein
VRGGSGWRQFRRGRAGGRTRSGRGAREGGGKAVRRGDLDGVKRSQRIPARNTAAAARC